MHDTAMRGTALNKGFAVLPDGRVLIATTRAELFVLDPRGYSVTEVTPIGRQITAGPPSAFTDVIAGPDGRAYVGTNNGHRYAASLLPGAAAPWVDLGIPSPGDGYVTDLAIHAGVLYAGTALTRGGLFAWPLAGGAWQALPLPGVPAGGSGSVTQVAVVGAHLYASYDGTAAGTDGTYVYDLAAGRWSDVEPGALWVVTAGPNPADEIVYARGAAERLSTYDPRSARPGVPDVHPVGTLAWPGGQMPSGPGWIDPTTLLTSAGPAPIGATRVTTPPGCRASRSFAVTSPPAS